MSLMFIFWLMFLISILRFDVPDVHLLVDVPDIYFAV